MTQVRRLDQVQEWIREAIAFVLEVDEQSFDIAVGLSGREIAQVLGPVPQRTHQLEH